MKKLFMTTLATTLSLSLGACGAKSKTQSTPTAKEESKDDKKAAQLKEWFDDNVEFSDFSKGMKEPLVTTSAALAFAKEIKEIGASNINVENVSEAFKETIFSKDYKDVEFVNVTKEGNWLSMDVKAYQAGVGISFKMKVRASVSSLLKLRKLSK